MIGFCGIGWGRDKLEVILVSCRTGEFIPLTEIELNAGSQDFLEAIQSNMDIFEEELRNKEKKYSIEIEKIYIRLPLEWAKVKVIEDTIPLTMDNKRKLITAKDINNAKKYMENAVLEWNEVCLHNIVLEYYIDDKKYFELPEHLEGRKLRLKSLIVFMGRNQFQKVYELFENIERKFMGFVYSPLADLSVNTRGYNRLSPYATINIGESSTFCTGIVENYVFYKTFEFGEDKLRESIKERFLLSDEVSTQILSQYISFRYSLKEKELVVKDKDSYINISIGSVNNFVKDITAKEIDTILEFLKEKVGNKFKVLFLGRIPLIKGFYNFLREHFPFLEIDSPCFYSPYIHLLGCIKYGYHKFLERVHSPKRSLWQAILNVYKDYF